MPYLYSCFFIVKTDHQALTTLQRMAIMQKDPNSHFMRWSMALQEYHYEILYKKGVNNGNTDGSVQHLVLKCIYLKIHSNTIYFYIVVLKAK